MLKVLYAGCPDLSLVISTHFALEMCRSPKSPKNPLKTYFNVHGHTQSLLSVAIESLCTTSY